MTTTTPDFVDPPVDTPPADAALQSPTVQASRILPADRVTAALEVIMCSGFPTQLLVLLILTMLGMKMRLPDGSLSGHFVFALTLSDTVLLVGLVIFFLRAHHESPREALLGWRPAGGSCSLESR